MAKSKKKGHQLASNLSPATSLPPELLLYIFHLVKTERSTTASCSPPFEPSFVPELRWVPETTHICHQWRITAVADAFLWTDICVSASHCWASEFLKRSRQSPSKIRLSCDLDQGVVRFGSNEAIKKKHFEWVRLLYKKASLRIESLTLEHAKIDQMVELLLSDSTNGPRSPNLKTLVVSGHWVHRPEPYVFGIDEEPLSYGQKFVFNLHELYQLELNDVRIAWGLLKQCRALTNLHLEHAQDARLDSNPKEFLEVLRMMPCLNRLVFHTRGIIILQTPNSNVASREPLIARNAITLPHLQFVTLKHPSPLWLRHFLLNISPFEGARNPANATLPQTIHRVWNVRTLDLKMGCPWHTILFPITLKHIPSRNFACKLSFDPQDTSDHSDIKIPALSFWPSQAPNSICSSDPSFQYHPDQAQGSGRSKGVQFALDMLCYAGAHDRLEELEFSHGIRLPLPRMLAETIGRLPHLRAVRLGTDSPSAIFLFTSLTKQVGGGALPYKRLVNISVGALKLFDASMEREILRALMERHRLGFPIHRLKLPTVDPAAGYDRDTEALQRVVLSVEIGV